MAKISQDLNATINWWNRITDNFVFTGRNVVTGYWTIKPKVLSSFSPITQVMRMRALAEVIKKSSAAFSISLYTYSRTYDFSNRIKHFDQKLKTADNNTYKAKLLDVSKKRFEQITDYQNDVREKVYLLCIHGISRTQIQDFFNKAQGSLIKAGWNLTPSTKDEIFGLFNRFFFRPENNRTFIIRDCEMCFKSKFIQINRLENGRTHKCHCKIVNVDTMPFNELEKFWLEKLANINDIIFSLQTYSWHDTKKRNDFVEDLKSDFENIKQYNSEIKNQQIVNNYQIMQGIINDLSKNKNDVKLCKLMIMVYGETKTALKEKYERVVEQIKYFGAEYNDLVFSQRDAYLAMQPICYPEVDKDAEVLLTSDAIGLGYPFTQSAYIDPLGTYIGKSTSLTPIIWDIYQRKTRSKGNFIVFGDSGGRKSTLLKMSLLDSLIDDRCAGSDVLDWENEYSQLAANFHQHVYYFTRYPKKDAPAINPYQIPIDENNDIDSRARIQSQTDFIIDFISSLLFTATDIPTSLEIDAIKTSINRLYKEFNVVPKTNLNNIPNLKWPILDDHYTVLGKCLKEVIRNKHSSDEIIDAYKKVYRLMADFVTGGNYDGVFNRHQNLIYSKKDVKIRVFNTFGLKSSATNIQYAMTSSIAHFWQNKMNEHRLKYPLENDPNAKFYNFIFDEGHKIVDPRDTRLLTIVAAMYQQARKYYCNIGLATPSIITFTESSNPDVLSKTQAILDTCEYVFILQMTVDALINEVNKKLFVGSTQLTDDEIYYLSDDTDIRYTAGRFLLLSKAFRILGQIDSGRHLDPSEFNVSLDEITEIAQLWGTPIKS